MRSIYIQNQDLGEQIEDIIIQLCTIPSTTRFTASLLSRDLPVIPPFDGLSCQQREQRQQRPTSPPQYQYPPSEKYGAQVVPKTAGSEILSRGNNSLELSAGDRYSPINGLKNGSAAKKPVYGGGLARNPPQANPTPSQRVSSSGTGAAAVRTRNDAANGSRSPPPVAAGRQVSARRTSMDSGRRDTDRDHNSQVPRQGFQGEKHRMPPANGFYRDLQVHTSTLLTPMSGRRATVGEIVPFTGFKGTGGSPSTKVPLIPPKNKNRPTSMDGKVRGSDLLPGVEYTTVKLDQPHYQQSRPGMNFRFASTPATEIIDKDMDGRAAAAAASRSFSSNNTFGQGYRPSLNNTGSIMGKTGGSGPNDLSIDGSSSCSSATSSGFSATSISSVSPPATQTRKHSVLMNNGMSSKQSGSPNTSVTLSATPFTTEKPLRDVDFDNQIREHVRELASSASNSSFGVKRSEDIRESDNRVKKLEIQATDPRVLDAPIVVPEDLPMSRKLCLRETLSGIVLPPMEPKRTYEGMSSDAVKNARRVSISNIPIPMGSTAAGPSSPTNISKHYNHNNQGSKMMFLEQPAPSSSAIPRPSPNAARRRSVDPTTPRPMLPTFANGDNNNVKTRARAFERT